MNRRTKLIATIGPASEDEATLKSMMEAGMNVARLGLAHGKIDEHIERYYRIRKVAEDLGVKCGILADLPGPKVRCATFGESGVEFETGDHVRFVVGSTSSNREVIEVDYAGLHTDVMVGDRLNIGDGRLIVDVTAKEAGELVTTVTHGGQMSGQPGVHIPADRLQMATPTAQDFKSLDAFLEVGIDMVAISFVRSAHDIRRVGTEPFPRGPLIVAKIETRAAVENLPGIIEASGAVMVARGDLGNEMSIEELPHLQKRIIRDCIAGGRPVITATQMLETMITNPAPTRAEASDVANAVWDGSSALMLSGETAVGVDPANVVRTMARIARRADEEFDHVRWAADLAELRMTSVDESDHAVTDAMTLATWRAAEELHVAAILCVSGSGFTVRSMARFRPSARIIGFSHDEATVNQLTMSWGTTPMLMTGDLSDRYLRAVQEAKNAGHVRSGELVAILAGGSLGRSTNTLHIERVP